MYACMHTHTHTRLKAQAKSLKKNQALNSEEASSQIAGCNVPSGPKCHVAQEQGLPQPLAAK